MLSRYQRQRVGRISDLPGDGTNHIDDEPCGGQGRQASISGRRAASMLWAWTSRAVTSGCHNAGPLRRRCKARAAYAAQPEREALPAQALGGAEFRLPLLLARSTSLEAVILNKAISLVVVATALPFRAQTVPAGHHRGRAVVRYEALECTRSPSTRDGDLVPIQAAALPHQPAISISRIR